MNNSEQDLSPNETEVLKQADHFASNDEIKSAIELLEKALNIQPKSEKIHRELTRLYKIKNSQDIFIKKEDALNDINKINFISDDDLSFLMEKENELKEDEYKFNIKKKPNNQLFRDFLHKKTKPIKEKIIHFKEEKKLFNISHNIPPLPLPDLITSQFEHQNFEDKLKKTLVEPELHDTPFSSLYDFESYENESNDNIFDEFEESWQSNFIINESINDDVKDDSLAFEKNEVDFYALWDDDLSGEQDDKDFGDGVLNNHLTHEERARFVAVECVLEFGWHTNKLPFLIEIFSSTGWGNSRNAIRREVHAGTTFEELQIAYAVKNYWQESSRYWITFSKVWKAGESSDAIYRHCSWKQALRLIRIFDGIPTFEEVYDFLENEFEYWYQSRIFRSYFSAFNKYLFGYRLNEKNIISFSVGFDFPVGYDGLNSAWENYNKSDEMYLLKELGIDLDNKYSPKNYFVSDLYSDEYLLEIYRSSEKSQQEGTD